MNTCGGCTRRPAVAARLVGVRKGVREGPLRWKAPRALEGLRIDVRWREGAHTTEPLARQISRSRRTKRRRPREVSEGSFRRSDRMPTKLRCFSPTSRQERRAWQPNGPKPASRRQARSRWRPDDRKVVRRRPRNQAPISARAPKAISKSKVGGFPTMFDRQPPKVVFRHGCS